MEKILTKSGEERGNDDVVCTTSVWDIAVGFMLPDLFLAGSRLGDFAMPLGQHV
jgi:hypothetical protein